MNLAGQLRKAHWAALIVGTAVFTTAMFFGLSVYRSRDLPLDFGGIVNLVHAAAGVGFFSGFVILLADWMQHRREKG